MAANDLLPLSASLVPSCIADLADATNAAIAVTSVTTDAEARIADASVKTLKACVRAIHDQRMAVTRRVDAFKKSLITEEEEICAVANAELARVQGLCTAFLTAVAEAKEAKRRAEAERIAKANADEMENSILTGEEPKIEELPAEVRRPVVNGVRAREYWTFDIVDDAAVPRQYCCADRRLIQHYMDEAKRNGADISALSISGVTFRKEIRV